MFKNTKKIIKNEQTENTKNTSFLGNNAVFYSKTSETLVLQGLSKGVFLENLEGENTQKIAEVKTNVHSEETYFLTLFEERKKNFERQKKAQLLIWNCGRYAKNALLRFKNCNRTSNGGLVSVYRSKKTRVSFFGGLIQCGGIWSCPVCSSKIKKRRKEEIRKLVFFVYSQEEQEKYQKALFEEEERKRKEKAFLYFLKDKGFSLKDFESVEKGQKEEQEEALITEDKEITELSLFDELESKKEEIFQNIEEVEEVDFEALKEEFEKSFVSGSFRFKKKKCLLITFTHPHKKEDKLEANIERHFLALKKLRCCGSFQNWKAESGFAGLVRAAELTRGFNNGWHFHTHELWIVDEDFEADEAFRLQLTEKWLSRCIAAGFKIKTEEERKNFRAHAVDVIDNAHASDYLAKIESGRRWGVEQELSSAASKKAGFGGLTPFELLDYQNTQEDFLEYFEATRRRKCFYYSRGLKKAAGIAEKTDEELVEEFQEEAGLLLRLKNEVYKLLVKKNKRAEFQKKVELMKTVEEVLEFLESLDVNISEDVFLEK